ncbi:MAG: thiol-disulfide oxidoreductase DCC family protein [Tepidisphaeraceae bacterium]
MTEPAIVLFDGECNFCNASIRFIIDRDPAGRFRFASLQSDAGRKLVAQSGLPDGWSGSMVVVENGAARTSSSAALRVARGMRFPWPMLYGLIVVPPFVRDAVYNAFAARRYRWFGRSDACPLPPAGIAARFIS